MKNLTQRPVCGADRDFLCELYASTREAELALVPWPDAQKRAFVESQFASQTQSYAETHPEAAHEIILWDDAPVGRLYLSREASRLYILDITIAPGSRNAGIGSQVLNSILGEADQAGKSVEIYVETYNPSLSLFQRLGFTVAVQDGFQLLLARPAAISGSGESNSLEEAAPPND